MREEFELGVGFGVGDGLQDFIVYCLALSPLDFRLGLGLDNFSTINPIIIFVNSSIHIFRLVQICFFNNIASSLLYFASSALEVFQMIMPLFLTPSCLSVIGQGRAKQYQIGA